MKYRIYKLVQKGWVCLKRRYKNYAIASVAFDKLRARYPRQQYRVDYE